MADKEGKLTAWEIVNGNLLAMKMKDQVYIEVCDWEFETIREELQKYNKYKRAFELLKRELDVRCYDGEVWFLNCIGETNITKEEYKLLEELMKCENS